MMYNMIFVSIQLIRHDTSLSGQHLRQIVTASRLSTSL